MDEKKDALVLHGVDAKGYGKIPKLVMKDPDLTVEAKAIYAYISSYSGGGSTAFPSVSLMCHDLKMGENRFYKHRKLLVDKNYIQISKNKSDKNEFSNNVYTLVSFPNLQFEGMENEGMRNEGMRNEGTNNNSSNNNSINNNKSKSSPEKVKEKQKKTKRSYGEFKNVKLTDEEVNKLKDRFPESYEGKINDLSFYIESKGAKYKSHYATILTWDRKDKENESVKFSPSNEKEKYGWKDQVPI